MSEPDPLARLKLAHVEQRRSAVAYRAALLGAVDAGYGYAELARELGVARQVIRTSVMRASGHASPVR